MKRLLFTTAAFGCAISSSAFAGTGGLDWGFIHTAGDPDQVVVFDLNNPGGSNTLLGTVDGNFNRGMDFDSINSFYYFVSTDSLNDPGDRGLWRWDNGVNTQLATIGFNDGGDGDATLSNDLTQFFITVDDGDATPGDSLYVFENLSGTPTFTEVGETGLSQLIGIAMDPTSGLIYGYDSGSEALYTIDPGSGIPSLVGPSGLSLGAIGGMDFNADGSQLVLSQGGDLFDVNVGNGALSAIGDVGENVSAFSFRIPAPGALALLGVAGLAVRRRRRA